MNATVRRHEERQRFFEALERGTGKPRNECEQIGMKLIRLAKKSHRFAEAVCCREVSKREEREDEARDARAVKLATDLGCKGLRIQGDPRGAVYAVLFHDENIWNSFGGKECGYVVPD